MVSNLQAWPDPDIKPFENFGQPRYQPLLAASQSHPVASWEIVQMSFLALPQKLVGLRVGNSSDKPSTHNVLGPDS